ncbi:GGDEF domain protein, partial [Vibrio cholerae O1 str. 116063]
MKICQTILNKLAQDYIDQDRRLKISVSIGITKYSGEKLNADQLLFNASLALKECKRNHNTRIRFYVHISEHSDQSFRYYPITHFGLNRSLIP